MARIVGTRSDADRAKAARIVRLRVNGVDYSGWKSVRVLRGIESLSGSFDLGVSERWAGRSKPWPIHPEDECQILLGDEVVLTGYVDRRESSYGPDDHSVSVSGRDRAAALFDCSASIGAWEFFGISLLSLAQRLADTYGIKVAAQPGIVPLVVPGKFSIDPGESAFESLERACRVVGVLAFSDGMGGIVLARPGEARCETALVEGENIIEASASFDASDRFRKYEVRGQMPGTDSVLGDAVAAVSAKAEDPNVRRSERMLIIRAESSVNAELAKRRAEWEATVRAARSDTATVRVQGWTQGNGELWPVNALVHLRSPMLGIDSDALITQAAYTLDLSGGTIAELHLKRRDAFAPEPYVPSDGALSDLGRLLR